jgi:choline transport protein
MPMGIDVAVDGSIIEEVSFPPNVLSGVNKDSGGPEGFIYGFVLVWAGCLALFMCMSEMASMAPTAGGQYHWVAMMSPRRCQRFASYVEGWLAVTGWQGSSVSAAQLSARTVLGLAKLCHPKFEPTPWQEPVVAIALIAFAMLINVTGGMVLPRFEGMVLVLHLVGFFAVLVPLLTLGQQVDAPNVFDVFINQGNFPSKGLTYWIGLSGIMYAFVGGDGAIHMSEEIQNAEVTVPRGIMFNYVVNGALAFGISIAALFSRGTLDSITNPPSGFAIIEVISHSVQSLQGAAIMVSVITVLQISAGVSNYASATRILWGFARDQGVPGWKLVSKVRLSVHLLWKC